jgi:carbon storage regulator
MLILTRKSDESIIIGNNIQIKVLKIQGNQVHIGIDAPKDISVYRLEIYEQIRKENVKAVQMAFDSERIKQIEDNLTSLKSLFAQAAPPKKGDVPAVPPKKGDAPSGGVGNGSSS